MKLKMAFMFLTAFITQCTFSQENTGEGVDLLKAPSSPASQLLNIAPNTIERPTDLSSLWISINNTTEGLSKFPTNYALDFSPASLFGGKGITLKDLNSTNTGGVMWQSFVISTGIKQEEDTLTGNPFYKTAIGLKCSFIRPRWSGKTETRYQEILAIQRKITDLNEVAVEEILEDPAYLKLIEKKDTIDESDITATKNIDEEIEILFHQLMVEKRIERVANNAPMQNELKKRAREFHIERVGPFLDFSAGFSAQFPTNKFNYSLGDRSGAWLTGGFEGGEKKLSIIGIVRYLYQPESIYADPTGSIPFNKISTFDAGTRVLYSTKEEEFSISFESVYRSILNKNIVDPSWKLNFSAEYDLGFNKKISISFGRDFDGVVSKGGNLIAALNLITGFGNKKTLQ
ncbi:MAG TPA: hypothetical protein VK498_04275 [Ferruginibacter sp.]|nr:hypothetical protein [Ferruginibacter sp.]